MPIYTYECPAGHRWEEQRSINDPTVDWSEGECSEGFSRGERVFAPGDMRPVFKGRGWARKDHKDASKP